MKKSNSNKFAAFLLIFALFTSVAFAETPTEVIKKANNKISEIQKNNKDARQIEAQTACVLEETTSYSSLTNNVKSSICVSIGDAKCKEFSDAFSEMIKLSYTKKLAKYKAESTEYLGEKITGSKATVNTKIKVNNNYVKINYELEKISKKWTIVNYIIDDINTAENYKKQFKRMLKKDSIDSIIQNLKKKTDNLKNGKGE